MKVITVINQKGGVGKTTLSINVATAFARAGARVLLIDADPQESSLEWAGLRAESPLVSVISLAKPHIHRDIKALGAGYDFVIIDGPPRSSDLARSAVAAADFVMIPVQPSPADVWATAQIVKIVEEAQIVRPELRAAFVMNRRVANTAIARSVLEIIEGNPEFSFPLFNTVITQRVTFAEALASGSTVFDLDESGPAAAEIEALRAEITEVLQ